MTTGASVKGPLFFSLSQEKFPSWTNSGLHSPANTEFLAVCIFLHVLALVGEAAPLSGVGYLYKSVLSTMVLTNLC